MSDLGRPSSGRGKRPPSGAMRLGTAARGRMPPGSCILHLQFPMYICSKAGAGTQFKVNSFELSQF